MIRISRAGIDDSEVLAQMNKRLIEDEGHRNPMSVAELKTRMEGWLRSNDWEAVFVDENDARIGYALYQWRVDSFNSEERFVYLRQFFIATDYRRRGVGSQAFQAIKEKFWAGASRIEVEVLTKNAVGIAFWHRLGFADYQLGLKLNLR